MTFLVMVSGDSDRFDSGMGGPARRGSQGGRHGDLFFVASAILEEA